METRVSRIKIPTTGVFDFPKLIQEGKGKYVDKTALLYELCNDADAQLIGADISGERQSARGRADAVLADKGGIYVFEFKYGKTPKEALDQARTKEYGNPRLDTSLPVFYVGINYDPAKRGIDDPLVEAMS